MDLSAVGLRKLVDFPIKGECCRIVPPSEVEAQFLKLTGRKYKKDVWQDIAPWFGFSLTHSQPHSERWVVDDFKKFSLEGHPDGYALDKQARLVISQVLRMVGKANRSFYSTMLVLLAVAHVDPRMADYRPNWHMWVSSEIRGHLGHDRNDKFSGGKFREGWQAIVRIVTADFLAKQATTRHDPLLLEACNALTNTRAEWDNEKGELVREREALKEELNKAKEMAAEAEQCSEAVRLEKEEEVLDCYRGEALLQKLCDVNTTLNLHLRPWDGLFVDCFASALLSIPWVANLLKSLAEKRFVILWTIGRMTLESLQSPESYKTDTVH
ncbi:hypothetical protein R1flu_020334 [Riccia fluitans]|uniref:Uncharacterized protein n=1 Tax=Riccia fluitans TaxID=41844 RepID=A0ABD1ZNC8_9MARC